MTKPRGLYCYIFRYMQFLLEILNSFFTLKTMDPTLELLTTKQQKEKNLQIILNLKGLGG